MFVLIYIVMITQSESKRNDAKIIIGLGNPGKQYENTYHNVGIMSIVEISQINPDDYRAAGKKPFKYYKSPSAIFVIPEVFMNESGIAVKSALDYFGLGANDIIIIHDDSDQEIGNWKVVKSGSSGGHNGINSIISHLGTTDFIRIKIGIRGSPANKNDKTLKAGDFVLDKINKEDSEKLSKTIEEIILYLK